MLCDRHVPLLVFDESAGLREMSLNDVASRFFVFVTSQKLRPGEIAGENRDRKNHRPKIRPAAGFVNSSQTTELPPGAGCGAPPALVMADLCQHAYGARLLMSLNGYVTGRSGVNLWTVIQA